MNEENMVHIYNGVHIHTHTHTHTHTEYYSAITKNEIIPFATIFMELEIIIFNEVSQIGEDKYHLTSLISGI